MNTRKTGLALMVAGAAALAGLVGYSAAQVINVPQVSQINAADLFLDIVNGTPTAQNQYAPAPLLGNYSQTLAGNNPENVLIGGDATTNLFQRGTTGSSVTTTLTYGGPDRWAYWSGTATAMTVSKDTTAADLQAGYQAAFKMARTSGQTGVVQMCMAQEIESANVFGFQGATAEFDFDAVTGANFSPASGNVVVVFVSGTGTDQGLAGSNSAAFNYNAGGGGSGAWTGQVNTAVTVSLGGAATSGRYSAVAPIPVTATELAVFFCWTPVGTAGTNDYVAVGNFQLTRNSALASVAGTAGAALNTNDVRRKSFSRRSIALETVLQQRYYYSILEAAATVLQSASGNGASTTTCTLQFPFPVNMRAAPTFESVPGTTAFSASTWTITHIVTATALSTPFLAVLGANTINGGSLTATVASGLTTGQTCVLTGAGGGGGLGWKAEL